MSGETTNCKNLTEIGVKKNCSLSVGDYVTVKQNMQTIVTVRMPCNVNATVVYLGSNDASVSTGSNSSQSLDENGVSWTRGTAE